MHSPQEWSAGLGRNSRKQTVQMAQTGQFREWGRPLARPDSYLLEEDTAYSKAFFVVQHPTYPGDGLDILSNKTLLSGFYYRRVYIEYWRRYQGSGL
jgi:hypothetical protein